jgi:hypothetical protein
MLRRMAGVVAPIGIDLNIFLDQGVDWTRLRVPGTASGTYLDRSRPLGEKKVVDELELVDYKSQPLRRVQALRGAREAERSKAPLLPRSLKTGLYVTS